MTKDDPYYIGGIGGLGERSANNLSKDTDLALAIGTKLLILQLVLGLILKVMISN